MASLEGYERYFLRGGSVQRLLRGGTLATEDVVQTIL